MAQQGYVPFQQVAPNPSAQPMENIRATPDAFGAPQAQAGQRLGAAAERTGETGIDVATKAEALHNEANVNDAQSKYLQKATDILYRPESADGADDGGFYTKRGDNAHGAYQDTIGQLTAARQDLLATLPNPRQQKMFGDLTRKSFDYNLQDMGRHVDREINQAADKKTEAVLSTLSQSAALAANSGNFGHFDENIQQGVAAAKSWGHRKGYGEEWGDSWSQKWVGHTVGNVAKQLAANGDLEGAARITTRYESSMDKDSVLSIKTALKGKLQDQAASTFARNVVWGVTQPAEMGGTLQAVSDRIADPSGPEGTGKNPMSSAQGVGQFTNATWLDTVKRARPDMADRPEAELLGLRNNPEFARAMTSNLTAQNASILSDAGVPVTPGNVYLAHFAGPTGAIKTLSADPSTPISAVLSPEAIKANPAVLGGGKTVADLTNWANLQMSGVGPRAAVKFDKAAAITQALAAFPDDPAMRSKAVTAVNQQFAAVQLDAAARAQANTEQVNQARDGYVKEMMGGNFTPALVEKIRDDPRFASDPATREHLWTMATTHAQSSLGHDTKTYGQGFYDLFQRIHAPQGDPNRITDPSQLMPLVREGGPITLSGYEKLAGEIAGKRTPEGESESAMKKQFFANAKAQISGHSDFMKDPKGEEQYLKFMATVMPALDEGRKNGKPMAAMLNPDSPDYVGKAIAAFKRPTSQRVRDMIEANQDAEGSGPAGQQAADLTTKAGIVAAFQAGTITREDARKRLLEGGHAGEKRAAPVPVAKPELNVPLAQ